VFPLHLHEPHEAPRRPDSHCGIADPVGKRERPCRQSSGGRRQSCSGQLEGDGTQGQQQAYDDGLYTCVSGTSFSADALIMVLGINGTENTLKPPLLLIRQNPTGIRDFLLRRFAKVLISAPWAELTFYWRF
jgi:hypothetical protein